jgi:RNA polymerase sigma-70 factor (ECF subfamily)
MSPTDYSHFSDHELVQQLAQDDQKAFSFIVNSYYIPLCRTAVKYLRYKEISEETVQNVFVSLWERRHVLCLTVSLQAYLHQAVRYQAINYLKRELVKVQQHEILSEEMYSLAPNSEEVVLVKELEEIIAVGIERLPPKCRIIFDLSRNAGLTYKQIAQELGISEKTVETQMTIALSRLKTYLSSYWGKIALLPFLASLL